jgi:hypothetical protein
MFCPYTGDIFAKNQMTGLFFLYTVIYKIDTVELHVTYLLVAAIFGKRSSFTLSSFFYQRPQRPERPPRGPPLAPPLGGGGQSSQIQVGLLSGFGRLALRAAGLAGGSCRAG